MKYQFYTFRTFPWLDEIEQFQPFVFDKLRSDLPKFQDQLLKGSPEFLMGLAISNSTRFEPIAYNRFNTGKLNIQGREQYQLFVPSILNIKQANRGTNSFCNWTMYKLAEFIEAEQLPTKLAFLHVAKADKQLALVAFHQFGL